MSDYRTIKYGSEGLRMKKTIKGAVELGGVLLVLAGLMICMCDTADLDKQFMTIIVGVVMMMIGASAVWMAKGEQEDGLSR